MWKVSNTFSVLLYLQIIRVLWVYLFTNYQGVMGLLGLAVQGARLTGVWNLLAGATQRILATVMTRTCAGMHKNQSAHLLLQPEPLIGCSFGRSHTVNGPACSCHRDSTITVHSEGL